MRKLELLCNFELPNGVITGKMKLKTANVT